MPVKKKTAYQPTSLPPSGDKPKGDDDIVSERYYNIYYY